MINQQLISGQKATQHSSVSSQANKDHLRIKIRFPTSCLLHKCGTKLIDSIKTTRKPRKVSGGKIPPLPLIQCTWEDLSITVTSWSSIHGPGTEVCDSTARKTVGSHAPPVSTERLPIPVPEACLPPQTHCNKDTPYNQPFFFGFRSTGISYL